MKVETMTSSQVESACKRNNYVLFRLATGRLIGINSKCVEMAKRRTGFNPNRRTLFMSFKPCTFHEYISNKVPFYPFKIAPKS